MQRIDKDGIRVRRETITVGGHDHRVQDLSGMHKTQTRLTRAPEHLTVAAATGAVTAGFLITTPQYLGAVMVDVLLAGAVVLTGFAACIAWRIGTRQYQLWAMKDGRPVLLVSTRDRHLPGQVARAIVRAQEAQNSRCAGGVS